MKITLTMKCDRSGRTSEVNIDSADIATYEAMQAKREATLQSIKEFLSNIPSSDIPDLITIYRGKLSYFVNVNAEFCDKPIQRLLDQLFHTSDPTTRKRKPRAKSKDNGEKKSVDKNTDKHVVKEKVSPKSSVVVK